MEKRQYQIESVKEINTSLDKHSSSVFVLSTGGGKSVIITMLIDGWVKNNKRVLVLAHRRKLLTQLEGHFTKKNISCGMMQGKIEKNMDAPVIIASVNTATREKRIATLMETSFDYIVVDEAHRIASDSYANVLKNIVATNQKAKLLGVTATPIRRDKKALGEYFKDMVVGLQVEELQAMGYLAKSTTWSRPVKDLDQEVEKNSNDYNRASLSAYMKHEDRVKMAVQSYIDHAMGKQMLAFCVDREHAVAVYDAYVKAGIKSVEILDSTVSMEEQDAIIKRYEDKELDIIISIDILNEGVDLPETSVVQLNRPTMSLTIYMQQIGRGLRPKEDGSDLLILDNAGCSQSFGLVQSPKNWSLDPKESPTKPAEKNKIVGKRKDGSYTEDIDGEEDLELEEMTPEDYISKVVNSVEKAEEFNDKIRKEVVAKKIALVEAHVKAINKEHHLRTERIDAKAKSFEVRNGDDEEVYTINVSASWDSAELKMSISTPSSYRTESFEEKAQKAQLLNTVYQYFLKKDAHKTMVREIVLLEAKLKDQVDLEALKSAVRTLQEETRKTALAELVVADDTVLELPVSPRMDDVYPSLGYNYRRISTLTFKKGRVLVNNHVVLKDENDMVLFETKSAKVDKILEILDLGKYEFKK